MYNNILNERESWWPIYTYTAVTIRYYTTGPLYYNVPKTVFLFLSLWTSDVWYPARRWRQFFRRPITEIHLQLTTKYWSSAPRSEIIAWSLVRSGAIKNENILRFAVQHHLGHCRVIMLFVGGNFTFLCWQLWIWKLKLIFFNLDFGTRVLSPPPPRRALHEITWLSDRDRPGEIRPHSRMAHPGRGVDFIPKKKKKKHVLSSNDL